MRSLYGQTGGYEIRVLDDNRAGPASGRTPELNRVGRSLQREGEEGIDVVLGRARQRAYSQE